MKVIRTTIVTPKPGYEQDLAAQLAELGQHLAKQPGFIEAYAYRDEGKLVRISIWESREAADHAATQLHTIALRARVNALSLGEREEHLAEVRSEQHAVSA